MYIFLLLLLLKMINDNNIIELDLLGIKRVLHFN